MPFTLLPAVDVADGLAVRPRQGNVSPGETSHGSPLAAALEWQEAGAEWIHLVDLDAAFSQGSNAELLASIIDTVDVPVQLSGGITGPTAFGQALSTNADRIVLATTALKELAWCSQVIADHGDRITLALDVHVSVSNDGDMTHNLIARGSTDDTGPDLWDTLAKLDDAGCARYVVTDVSRDGMLIGPNLGLYQAIVAASSTPIIASGGVSELSDLVQLATLADENTNLEGAIVGKALYAGRFTLSEALASLLP